MPPAKGAERQLIAANVDTLGIVTAATAEFSVPRLERYLVLAAGSGAQPLVILTKADLADTAPFLDMVHGAARDCPVVAIDAHAPETAAEIAAWTGRGHTIALVGSSGVGKTTLTNALTGRSDATAGLREDDQKGRHTTTFRALRPILGGGWIIDSPGMREVGLVEPGRASARCFSDIGDLAQAAASATAPTTASRDAPWPRCEAGALDAGQARPLAPPRRRGCPRERDPRRGPGARQTLRQDRSRGGGDGRRAGSAMSGIRGDWVRQNATP